jgi:acetyl-CoA carboxylase biotin carboxyl carrier protein
VSLTGKDVAEIAKLLDGSHFSSLDLQMGEFRLRIRRDGGWSGQEEDEEPEELSRAPAQAAASGDDGRGPRLRGDLGGPQAGEVDVPAPLLGNFYSAPRPGDPPFVNVGDKVNDDTIIGIIEVMKLMNPIRAEVAGTVVAVLAENGTAIAEGQPLLRVRTAA